MGRTQRRGDDPPRRGRADRRGAFRARAPVATLRNLRVEGDALRFRCGDDDVALMLGRAAPRWAAAIAKPPPTLAAKLGIAAGTRVLALGEIGEDELGRALATGSADAADPELIVARVDDADELVRIAADHEALLARRIPLWVVYTKGKGAPLGETAVRRMLRDRGLIDVQGRLGLGDADRAPVRAPRGALGRL